ncbi:MAG TPA: helix-turn-helix domain-containing protein [Candidatus Paceibacterota bacterium]|nr:helix-turn-helix domain-containing protein [Candidatus Paceibacterota bacterium]
MAPNDLPFEQFFAEKIKERGVTLKKLSEMTGIAPTHIENLLRGDFENMPSAPYFHGYLLHLGDVLGFDGEEWWLKLKAEGVIKNSGELDTLPRNRFIKQSPPKYLWWIGAGVIVLIYLAFQAPRIFGTPTIAVTFPDANPYVTGSSTVTLTGSVSGANSLYLVGANGEQEQIIVAPDGTWEKSVLLGVGPNPFEISAKKFLGGTANVTEQIFYQPAGGTTTTSTPTSTPTGATPTVPVTGTTTLQSSGI